MQKTINWNIIYKENSPKLLGICRRYVSDLATAEDLLQDSFLKAIENQHQLKIENALFNWLKKIVINNALQYLKKSSDFYTNEISSDFAQEVESNNESNFLSQQFSTEEMLYSIDSLPENHKAVFNLFFLENFSHAEIAEQLGININTSKSHLLRAKKNIKEQLMNSNKSSNTHKKRGIQLLVFLCFGNLLWAKSFQSNFTNFSITPQKSFQPEVSNVKFNVKKINASSSKKSITKWIIALLLIFSVVFFVWNSKILFKNSELNADQNLTKKPKQKLINREDKKPDVEKENITEQVSDKNNESKIEKIQKPVHTIKEVLVVKSKSTNITKTQINKNPPLENIINTKKELKPIQDSNKITKPKQVIVVKKIIKRDTIYIKK